MLNRIKPLQTTADRSARLGRMLLKSVGLMFAFAGVISLANEIRSGQQSTLVTGKIFDVRKKQAGSFVPVVEFTTKDDRVIHFQGTATRFKPVQGAPVSVLYEPSKPESARVDSIFQRWLLPSIATLIGFLFIVGAGYWRNG